MGVFVEDEVLRKVTKTIAGDEGVQVVMALKRFKDATDDQVLAHIAEQGETTIKLNDIRRILFKLYNHSIVQCDRLRDENTGWFIFRWRLQPDQVEGFVKNQRKRILKILRTRLDYEEEYDFYCCYTPGCPRLTFEDAMEYVFRCSVCGKSLKHFDNIKIIDALKKRINQLERELNE